MLDPGQSRLRSRPGNLDLLGGLGRRNPGLQGEVGTELGRQRTGRLDKGLVPPLPSMSPIHMVGPSCSLTHAPGYFRAYPPENPGDASESCSPPFLTPWALKQSARPLEENPGLAINADLTTQGERGHPSLHPRPQAPLLSEEVGEEGSFDICPWGCSSHGRLIGGESKGPRGGAQCPLRGRGAQLSACTGYSLRGWGRNEREEVRLPSRIGSKHREERITVL